jgi:hypothetical protein
MFSKLTLDELLVNALAQAFDVGRMNQQLGAVLLDELDAVRIHLHVRQSLPTVHSNDPSLLSFPAAAYQHQHPPG